MWVRWADGADASVEGDDGTIEMTGLTLVFPGGATFLRRLLDLLREPMPFDTLERELLTVSSAQRVAANLNELLNAQVLAPWDLTLELSRLHEETLAVREGPMPPPSFEITRTFREMGGPRGVALPYAAEIDVSLRDALDRRRTCRAFRARSLTPAHLGAILSLAASAGGNSPPVPKLSGGPPAQRPYPSGGALYPVEILVYPANVHEIEEGFYYYQPLAHRLVPFAPVPDEGLPTLLAGHPIESAAFFVLFFLDFGRVALSKYGKKSYRLALLEAGHLAQNVLLATAALRLAALPLCGFDDTRLSRAAGLRYPEQPVVYVLAIGTESGRTDE
jgi:SagB-type dehydrogenase family enzyme